MKYRLLIIIPFTFPFLLIGQIKSLPDDSDKLFQSTNYIVDTNLPERDSRFKVLHLQEKYLTDINAQDTIEAINTLLLISYFYTEQALYANAYEQCWNALILSDKINDPKSIAKTLENIGWLYILFKRDDMAIQSFNESQDIKRILIKKGVLTKKDLRANFYNLAVLYRKRNNLEFSQQYLDSCYWVSYSSSRSITNIEYLKAEGYYTQMAMGWIEEALEGLISIEPWFFINQPEYLVILYSSIADAYKNLGELNMSEEFYNKSIQYSDIYNIHKDYLPVNHERLSELYMQMGRHEDAYRELKSAMKLNYKYFDSRSDFIRSLFEINDQYRKEKEVQNSLIQEQRLVQLEQEDKIWLLQKLVLFSVIVFIMITVSIYVRHLKGKHKLLQAVSRKTQELEVKKNKELLDLKNKELALSALQLIEKEEQLKQLRDTLINAKTPPGKHDIKRMFKTVSLNNKQNWKQFEARIVSVNESFFKILNSKFPNLSNNEIKLCALLKLNFSSKEIAKLMNISNYSVQTSRYRLRKKLKLNRDENLLQYLNGFN